MTGRQLKTLEEFLRGAPLEYCHLKMIETMGIENVEERERERHPWTI